MMPKLTVKPKVPLPIRKRAAGQILTAFQSGIRELLLDLLRAIKVMIGEEASGPAGKMGEQAGDHRRKLGVVMLQFAVHQVELVGQRGRE